MIASPVAAPNEGGDAANIVLHRQVARTKHRLIHDIIIRGHASPDLPRNFCRTPRAEPDENRSS
jgi:hypothetical protein